jgi:hypothetical protein
MALANICDTEKAQIIKANEPVVFQVLVNTVAT